MLILIVISVIIVAFMMLVMYSCVIAAGRADKEQEKIENKENIKNEF